MKLEAHDTITECLFDIDQIVYADKSIGEIVKCRLDSVTFAVNKFGVSMRYKVEALKTGSSKPHFETSRIYATPEEAFK